MKLFFKWRRRAPQSSGLTLPSSPQPPPKITVQQWRSDEVYVGLGRQLLANPNLQLALAALWNSHPGRYVVRPDAPPEMRAALQAQGEGYTMALRNLESLAQLQEAPEQMEATFAPENAYGQEN